MLSAFLILSSCFAGLVAASSRKITASEQQGGTPQSDGFGGEFEFLNYGTCYIDPSDTRDLAVPFSWTTGNNDVEARGNVLIDNIAGTIVFGDESSNDVDLGPLAATTTSFYYGIPLTQISDGDTVTQEANIGNEYVLEAEYTLYQSPTIITTASTSIVPVTSPNNSPAIVFTSGTVTSTSTSTATPTTTITQVTGTKTIYAATPTVTKTNTITPPPYTHTDYKIEVTTTTPSCIPPKPNHKRRNAVRAVDVLVEEVHLAAPFLDWIPALFKRGTDIVTNYGTPSCGAYNPVTVYTTTVISNPVVFTTPSITVPSTTTVTTTVPGVATATSYNDILGTTTVTPGAFTVTKTTCAKPKTVEVTRTIHVVETVCGKKTHLCPTRKR